MFNLLILAFNLGILFGELLSLLGKLFIGLLQFLLLGLKFNRELLRLLQQPFRLHRRFDTVQHNADAGGELLEECKVRRGE